MVTCREIVVELSRLLTTCLAWVYGIPLALMLVLRIVLGDKPWMMALLNNFAIYCFLPLLLIGILALVTRSRWGLIGVTPLIIIGLIWLGPSYFTKNPPPAEGETMRVVTFNFYRDNRRQREAEDWINGQNADLIFLQEFPIYTTRALLHRLNQNYPYIRVDWRQENDWGNVFLSRYPIIEGGRITPADSPSVYTQQRYLIDFDGQQIAAYNVDATPPFGGRGRFALPFLDSNLSAYVTGYDDTVRNDQLRVVLDYVDNETIPFVLAGDFNTGDQSVFYEELSTHMRDAFRDAAGGFGGTWPDSAVSDLVPGFVPPLLRMDYIWYSDDFRAVQSWRGPRLGSDHLPLYAELAFEAS